jgi:hypothetical protein
MNIRCSQRLQAVLRSCCLMDEGRKAFIPYVFIDLEGPGLRNLRENRQNGRSLHYAPPNFLSRAAASVNFMRLSLQRAANVELVRAAK